MKSRLGWVSNSSSTSFVIGVTEADYVHRRWSEDSVYKYVVKKIDEEFPDFPKYKPYPDEEYEMTLGRAFFYGENDLGWKRSVESVLDSIDCESIEELKEEMEADPNTDFDTYWKALELVQSGFRVYIGYMPHNGDGGNELTNRAVTSRKDLKIEKDDFVLYFQGGIK